MKETHANAMKALEACRASEDFDMANFNKCIFGHSRNALGIDLDGWVLGLTWKRVSNAMGFGDCEKRTDPFRALVNETDLTQAEACEKFAQLINRTHRRTLGG